MISELGKNIKYYREIKGWSLNKLKTECGLGYSTLHDIENGKNQNLKSDSLEKIANSLGVTTNDLLGVEIEEITVSDIEMTVGYIFKSDELTLDEKELSKEEIIILKNIFTSGINAIRLIRRNE